MKLRDELPVDHRLATVYRYGAVLCGVALIVFGCLGFADALSPFSTSGDTIAGMTTNVTLSVISTVVGLVLIAGGLIGGNVASTVNMTVGVLFVLSGFYHVFVLDRSGNFLDFGMTNVLFSFVMGLVIMTFGMYGRVSGGLPHDNPYWRRRHGGTAGGATAPGPVPAVAPAPAVAATPARPPRRGIGRHGRP
ncbi:DUF4383 domain-containing protein [Streptomyces genisteinicus]|uniref:DUF4383 domain-containing protein n=1 Tax=Streptomyces genisteinicus TaxID=2768068 RepID=A0A7H0I0V9_9ACTN|nr:DUF4383 domain-containing protein [Streptomyces genisteinicus]QNP66425.1 DUF4383 domain-containing protein [Streptomyces genisteinicus]